MRVRDRHMHTLTHRNGNRESCIFISHILFPKWHNFTWVPEKYGRIDAQTGLIILLYLITFV